MLKTFFKTLSFAAVLSASLASLPAHAEQKSDFKVCWSIYVGWMPWGYLQDSGIMKKWADKYDISVDIVQINDYVESINQYTAGEYDGCSMTNMDALSIPAGGGIDTTALIVGDYSNGNDGIILKNATDLAAIKGQNVNLVELSVSHYLLARALEKVGLSEQDVTVVNTSDADMIATYATDDVTSVVTWNPLLSEIAANDNATLVFDSAGIPGEIIDIMMVNTETLADNPAFGKALVGAWYELMGIMASDTDEGIAARTAMAEASGTSGCRRRPTGVRATEQTTRLRTLPRTQTNKNARCFQRASSYRFVAKSVRINASRIRRPGSAASEPGTEFLRISERERRCL